MKLLNTGIADLLVVEVPTNATGFEILPDRLSFDCMEDDIRMPDYIPLPSGYKYTVLGRALELTEEQVKPLFRFKDGYGMWVELPHPNNRTAYKFGKTAFVDFLKANGILLENPYQHPIYYGTMSDELYTNMEAQYEEAQSKVSNPLILKAEKI
ncbi:hypothetical protein [Pedobacter faecalis]|uniref:hypothetical protein n=1 Tax=Pedobacter faecalis TaxID=3041495 RepID=UPI00254B5148|nr:hypothetical protein [Pedobacter sp. ELA7]